MVWFIFDHGQEQFVSWPIGGGRHCEPDRELGIQFSVWLG